MAPGRFILDASCLARPQDDRQVAPPHGKEIRKVRQVCHGQASRGNQGQVCELRQPVTKGAEETLLGYQPRDC